MADLTIISRLFLSVVLGGMIGFEREIGNRPAGFRTHILVCLGSCLVMLTSEYLIVGPNGFTLDATRLGAQVISGIGFLGAGTIIKSDRQVRGLTTAASLWVVACIGLAVGSGFYLGAIAGGVLVYAILILLKKIEKLMSSKNQFASIKLKSVNKPGQVGKLMQILVEMKVKVLDVKIEQIDDDWISIEFFIDYSPGLRKMLIYEILSLNGFINDSETP